MANELKMAKQQAIFGLLESGWSQRRIARELGINRETVGRYARITSKPAISTTGVEGDPDSKPAISTTGVEGDPDSKPAISTTGAEAGRASECREYHDVINDKLELGLSRTRIHQDLRYEYGFKGSYSSVKRYVNRLGKSNEAPKRRMETDPGQEAQIDFGNGPRIEENGKKRLCYIFRITLSCSRKSYSEPVYRQTTENFIRAIENSFRHFGGVPETLVIDNLRAAVTRADWYDPDLNPKILEFMKHYNTTVLPTKPYTPEHKGKIESGVKYVKNNALKGRKFSSLSECRLFLLDWETNIADTRIHGTTKKQVRKLFETIERPVLKPVPSEPFPFFNESRRKVHRDAHVEVDKSYYSVPPEYLCRSVWVRWNSVMVRILNDDFQQVAVHAKRDPGVFATKREHILDEKMSGVERGADYLLGKIKCIGTDSHHWSLAMLDERGIQGIRVLQGLLTLTHKHSAEEINRASKIALDARMFRLAPLRKLVKGEQKESEFADSHEIIRPLSDYQLALFDSAAAPNKERI